MQDVTKFDKSGMVSYRLTLRYKYHGQGRESGNNDGVTM